MTNSGVKPHLQNRNIAKMLFSVLGIALNVSFLLNFCYFLLKSAGNSDKQIGSMMKKAHIGHIGLFL